MFDEKSKLNYEIQENHIVITGNTDAQGEVVIPAKIKGLPVTEIEWSAFKGCTGLTAVTILGSVTEIGEEAFRGCTGLTAVTILGSVTEIGEEAFKGCTGLTIYTNNPVAKEFAKKNKIRVEFPKEEDSRGFFRWLFGG